MRTRLISGIALLLLPSLAFAGLPITDFGRPQPVAADQLGPEGLPVPARAGALSARSTLVPFGVGVALGTSAFSAPSDQGDYSVSGGLFVVGFRLAAIGLVFGPSAGYSYGGIPRRGTAGTLVRLGTLVGPAIVLSQASTDGEAGLGTLAGIALGLGLVAAEAVYDVATVEGSVRRHNASLARPVSWRLEPCTTPSAHAPGLALRARFGGPAEGS